MDEKNQINWCIWMDNCCQRKEIGIYRKLLTCKNCGTVFGPASKTGNFNSDTENALISDSIKQKLDMPSQNIYITG